MLSRRAQRIIENTFETFLFNSRIIVILAVIGSLVASLLMFIKGVLQIWNGCVLFVQHPLPGHGAEGDRLSVVLIQSVDSYLFATVLLIFAMGIYELFISRIDPASRTSESRPNWLAIHSLDDLKGAVGKVILMILIVRLFEAAVAIPYDEPLDLLFLSIAVILVAGALYLVHLGHKKPDEHAGSEFPAPKRSEPPPGH